MGFEKLEIWQESHQLTLWIYKISAPFPSEEKFGLTSQLRRAAASIPANIAEGFGRRTAKEKARFTDIALGSLEETRYFLILAKDLNYSKIENAPIDIEVLSRRIQAYRKAILSADSKK